MVVAALTSIHTGIRYAPLYAETWRFDMLVRFAYSVKQKCVALPVPQGDCRAMKSLRPSILLNRELLLGLSLLLAACVNARAAEPQLHQAQDAVLAGGATKISNGGPDGEELVSLSGAGQGVKFEGLTASSTLAIRYASVSSGHDQRCGQRSAGAQGERPFVGAL